MDVRGAGPGQSQADRHGELSSAEQSAGGGLRNLALSRGEVDRSTARRTDTDWLAAAWADPGTRVVVVEDGQAPVRFRDGDGDTSDGDGVRGAAAGAQELVFLSPEQAPDGVRFLLGSDADGVVYFGVAGSLPEDLWPGLGPDVRPVGLRQAGPLLSDRDVGLMTHAVALANWHGSHGHCPRCGAVTEPALAGHSRRCVNDGSEHFPRLDPAVIMLVTDPDDRCLLARNAMWPQGRVSILAGFVEPGESAEQAVAREVLEETGIEVGDARYLGSQPWPMPHSLMLGFRARTTGSLEIKVDAEEIAEANWFSRDELRAAIVSGAIRMPPSVSIAHRIIESWYGAPLGGAW
jgi:NAD+ diphosphatase